MFTLIVRILAGLIAAGFGLGVMAQEAKAPEGEKTPGTPPQPQQVSRARHDRLFEGPIDFWRKGLTYEAEGEEKAKAPGESLEVSRRFEKSLGQHDDWGQFVRLPNGELARFELPRPLVRVLEDPSDVNIKAYLDWKQARTGKILRAAERMKKYQEENRKGEVPPAEAALPSREEKAKPQAAGETMSAPPSPPQAGPSRASPIGDTTITYFRRPGCRWCDREDGVLAEWLKAHPGVALEVVEPGSRPELWTRYGVRGTPTLLLKETKTGMMRILEGFTAAPALDQALGEVSTGQGEVRNP